MINTIIFDLSEVYLNGLLGTSHRLEPILNVSYKEIDQAFKGEDLTDFFHGNITEDEYWIKLIKRTNWNISLTQLKKAVRDNFNEIEGTRDIIEKLKEKGYKIGLLSVHGKEWIDYCEEKFSYHKLFHSVMYSFEVSISKPDIEAYSLILKKLKAKPEECIFIDDTKKNIEAARSLGINAILFTNPKQLVEDLEKLSISLK